MQDTTVAWLIFTLVGICLVLFAIYREYKMYKFLKRIADDK